MDPNTALAAMRKLAADILRSADKGEAISESDTIELAEYVQSFDEWLSRGGFLPSDLADRVSNNGW